MTDRELLKLISCVHGMVHELREEIQDLRAQVDALTIVNVEETPKVIREKPQEE